MQGQVILRVVELGLLGEHFSKIYVAAFFDFLRYLFRNVRHRHAMVVTILIAFFHFAGVGFGARRVVRMKAAAITVTDACVGVARALTTVVWR